MIIGDTIVAQCTAIGPGAIALIRVSGTDAIDIVSKVSKLYSGKSIKDLNSHTIAYGSIIDYNSDIIDNVMFIVMYSPKTFTGEDTIEITCHNNQIIIENIIDILIKNGARIAKNGEFAQRAFLNNKIDLIQAESINELINSNNQLSLKKSLSKLNGSFSKFLLNIEDRLLKALAWCQASFEFLDEEVDFLNDIRIDIDNLYKEIVNLTKKYNINNIIKDGIRISLIGSVNVGKSSLFNKLVNKNRAIVSNIAGTTRDIIEYSIYRNNIYWTFADTAGIRDADNIIEKEGIELSFYEASQSDIIILIFNRSEILDRSQIDFYNKIYNQYKDKIILVKNKSDLKDIDSSIFKDMDVIELSVLNDSNIDRLRAEIEFRVNILLSKNSSQFLLNKRQYSVLRTLEDKLLNIIDMLSKDIVPYEIIVYELQNSLENLTELTGKTITEESMDRIFKDFCVGK
jgi:tRNA modification GTPase